MTAPQVIVWAAGDSVEYGTDRTWRTRDFWGPREEAHGYYPGDPSDE